MRDGSGMLKFSLPIALIATLSAVTVVRADNLVLNPGFESGKQEWVLFVPSEFQGTALEWDMVEESPHDGAVSMSMTSGEPARWALGSMKRIPVAPGEKYRLSAWVRFGKGSELVGSAPAAYIRLVLQNAESQDISDPLLHIHIGLNGDVARSNALAKLHPTELPGEGWHKIEGIVAIPQETATVRINLFVEGVKGTVYWDDVSLELVPPETELSPVLGK